VQVNKTSPLLFRQADNPYDMMKMSVEEIREIIKPCGLSPMKSKGIHGLSKILVEKYNGEVPNTFEDLESLPAVGHKTASVVMTQWFGVPAFPVDTHIHRLAYRWGLSNGKNVEQTEKDLKRLIPESKWNKAHLQIIYFGRQYCPAKNHKWRECPICSKYMRKSLRS
jgi:endonuclease-3